MPATNAFEMQKEKRQKTMTAIALFLIFTIPTAAVLLIAAVVMTVIFACLCDTLTEDDDA